MDFLKRHKHLILTCLVSSAIIGYFGEPERISLFAGQIILFVIIGLISLAYLKIITKKLENQTFKTIKSKSWANYFTIGIPAVCITAPCLEEAMYRAPLLILFNSPTPAFWLANICLGAYFGFIHHGNNHVTTEELIKAEEEMGEEKSPDEKRKFAQEKNADKVKMRKILHVIISSFLGVGVGYLVVDHQSLWIGVTAHAIWNLVMPFVIMISFFIIALFGIPIAYVVRKL